MCTVQKWMTDDNLQLVACIVNHRFYAVVTCASVKFRVSFKYGADWGF